MPDVDMFDIPGDLEQQSGRAVSEDVQGSLRSSVTVTTTGTWIEEGVGTVSGGVATATVSHFSAWNFDMKFDDPACTHVKVATSIAAAGQSVQARVTQNC